MKHLMLAAAILCAPLSAGATTIFSDSFENPVNTQTWQVYDTFGSWNSTTGTGIEIQKNGAVGGITAKTGIQYVELDSDSERGGDLTPGTPTNSSMTTVLKLNGGSYRLDYWYRPRTTNLNDNRISVYIAGFGEGLFTTLLGSFDATTSDISNWVKISYQFFVDGTKNDYALTFQAEGTSNELGGFIDDVSLAAVPVPAAGFLLIGALGGLVALRRRKMAA
jgi:hypothetical protein